MVYGIPFKKLGFTTFGMSLLAGVGGGGVATFGIYWRPQNVDVNFGGSLLKELYCIITSFAHNCGVG